MGFTADVPPKGGFNFDLCRRNEMLVKKGMQPPTFRKTGTTIVGLVFQDGVVLGADTRATEGPIVADKNCEKIHYMASNIYCCGAGTAADTEAVTDMISSQLHLHRYATGRESRVVTALTLLKSHLFRYQGHVSTALVLGGVDITGPHLHTVRRIMSCESKQLESEVVVSASEGIKRRKNKKQKQNYVSNSSDCVDDVAYAIMLEMSKLSYKVSEADVTRARNQLKSSLQLHLDGTSPIAEDIGRQLLTYGRRLPTAELFARIDAVDASTIKRVANRFIFDQDLAIAVIGPIQKLPDYHWFRRRTYMLRY